MEKLTQERLKEVLLYDFETGIFVRRINVSNIKSGAIAGSKLKTGYMEVGIDNVSYLQHRLAWLYVHGYFPENQIDHIDRVRDNNRLGNLREVSRSCNSMNSYKRSDNTSGIKGVCWDKGAGLWKSRISLNGLSIYVGRHRCFTEAVAHRLCAEQFCGYTNCDKYSTAFEYMRKYISK